MRLPRSPGVGPGGRRAARADRFGAIIGTGLWIVAAWLAHARFFASVALDFGPVRSAGAAVLHGRPIYGVHDFVYPPFAAVAAVPLALLRPGGARDLYSILQVLLPTAAVCLLTAAALPRRYRYVGAAVAAVLMLKSDVFIESLPTYNVSLLFVVPMVLVILLWERWRWTAGAVVWAVATAIKPLLVAALLVALVLRRRRAVVTAVAVLVGLTLLGGALSHDLDGLRALPGRIVSGTNLRGDRQPLNVSLSSVAAVHPTLSWPLLLLRIAGVGTVAVVLLRSALRRPDLCGVAALVGMTTLVVPVCGSLSEVHYGVLALPPCVVIICAGHAVAPRMVALGALLVLCVPAHNVGLAGLTIRELQLRWAAGQSLALLACVLACLTSARRPAPEVRSSSTIST